MIRNATVAAMFGAVSLSTVAMEVDLNWTLADKCSSKSPKLMVTNIPGGATGLSVKLTDNDMASWNHGGGWVKVDGQKSIAIPEGALNAGYNGPCPPNFSSFGHDYTFSVKAEGKDGVALATASKTATFSASKVK